MKRLLGLLLATAALALAADQVPFVATFTSSVPGGSLPSCPALVPLATVGTGQATHLGLFTATEGLCLNPGTGEFSSGHFTLTAANGDTISGTSHGQLVPTGSTTATIYGVFVITGGTGRFSGATGGGVATGSLDLTTFEANDFVMRGTISRPNH
jgi:hypothetical protein